MKTKLKLSVIKAKIVREDEQFLSIAPENMTGAYKVKKELILNLEAINPKDGYVNLVFPDGQPQIKRKPPIEVEIDLPD